MANTPYADEFRAIINSSKTSFPEGGTLSSGTNTTVSTTAGFAFYADKGQMARLFVYNSHASQTIAVWLSLTTTATLSSYVAKVDTLAAGASQYYNIPVNGAIQITGSGADTTNTCLYHECTKTATS